ncbi:inorganic pyrophosphatase [Candidatus Roizmanbacteria bacterium RIFCSPHIGHO2_01_FULL_39_12b]|uniref:Inorganic pyrophosphatase n=1 Tax=Candidatus Roizmanbacteria bacterium RIFCSPHIGHO2_01_FULL_39_12b TaxID=1802030 RepID=A0A1F7G935_9BACT|nr:MAG: inorganic pyrophosphatase [Candidatus Roizmanbacteria bacterium RIFCSPHIGHO2_01_FULL_39_12b]OGK45900.1 MAG: inorganic pyrophosphatase [Candidatus Roizmanbacteria bacterium RIFCSPLOWO2_01_FULL_39_19]
MDLSKLTAGEKSPDEVNVFIEIPQGGTIKYELNPDSGFIFVDRFVYGAMYYPFNYGFIPQTHAEDGDPLDILVVSTFPTAPGTVLPSRPIGMLEMEDEEGIDTKIIAVPRAKIDPFYKEINDVTDLPEILREKIKNFFDRYKDLEPNKWVKTRSFLGREKAYEAIKNCSNIKD